MYPDLYSKMDAVSPSILEGGPVPILESMMSNCVPVALKLVFVQILLIMVKMVLFDINAGYKEVIGLIDKALDLKINTRETVKSLLGVTVQKIDDLLTVQNSSNYKDILNI